jgi:prepilin-type N-terminal cleavage/methylation domain-containing protein/prepilin-type processing-associated H-X9-DG protein
MKSSAPRRGHAGFSLIELMITLVLVLIMAYLMYGFASGKHQRTQQQLCADNLQKIYLALQIYANDFHGGLPAKNQATTSEPVLDLLVPKYSVDTAIFICPGGRDAQIPAGEPLANHKISYAYYMNHHLSAAENITPFALVSDRQVDNEPKHAGEIVFSPDGKSPGNNHHRFGGNFLFSDGHVQKSGPQLTFSLAYPPDILLLNPKP